MTMELQPAPRSDLFPIVTRLRADEWEQTLRVTGLWGEFQDIPEGLRRGFSIGLDNFTLASTYIPENHYTLPEHHEFLLSKYSKEIAAGRISRGYTPSELFSLIGHFCTAPISIAEGKAGKLRVVVNFSYPRHASRRKRTILDGRLPRERLDFSVFLPRDTLNRSSFIHCVRYL